jgi:hypothetical protein
MGKNALSCSSFPPSPVMEATNEASEP